MCTTGINWLQNFSETFIAPFAVAAITYFLFGKVDELRKRRSYSRLGAAIIHSLIEEVERGRDAIRNTLDPINNSLSNPLPRKSWNGINTVPDEVLLRILELAKGNKDVGFPASEIRIHTKNYFDHMVTNWDQIVDFGLDGGDFKTYAVQNFSNYDKASTAVIEMLKHIEKLLESNATKLLPK